MAGNPYLRLSLAAFFPFHPPGYRGLSSGLRCCYRTIGPSSCHPHCQADCHPFHFPPPLPERLATTTATPLALWSSPRSNPSTFRCTGGCISCVSWCVCRGTFCYRCLIVEGERKKVTTLATMILPSLPASLL